MENLPLYGFFLENACTSALLTALIIATIGYVGSPLIVWTLAIAVVMIGFAAPMPVMIVFAVLVVLFNIKPLRVLIVSGPLMKLMAGFMPKFLKQSEWLWKLV